jgi:hypothetical protein
MLRRMMKDLMAFIAFVSVVIVGIGTALWTVQYPAEHLTGITIVGSLFRPYFSIHVCFKFEFCVLFRFWKSVNMLLCIKIYVQNIFLFSSLLFITFLSESGAGLSSLKN